MAVGNKRLAEIIQHLRSGDSDTIDNACGVVTDLVRAFDVQEVHAISIALANMAANERDKCLRENELHALVELSDSEYFDPNLLGALTAIDRSSLAGS